MSEVLTDLYSLFSFKYLYDRKSKNFDSEKYAKCFHLIENLVLCDKVVVEKNGLYHHGLKRVYSEFPDAFRLIEDKRLYEKTPYETIHMSNDFSQRANVYAEVAKENDIYYSPHPERERVLTGIVNRYVEMTTKSVIEQFDQKIIESQDGVISNIDVKIPPVVEHVIYFSKAQNISISESINEIRYSKNGVAFRRYFADLDGEMKSLSPRKKLPAQQKLCKELDQLYGEWLNDMNSEVRYRKRKIKLAKIPIIGKILESVGMSEININDPIIFPGKPHLLFINDLYQK